MATKIMAIVNRNQIFISKKRKMHRGNRIILETSTTVEPFISSCHIEMGLVKWEKVQRKKFRKIFGWRKMGRWCNTRMETCCSGRISVHTSVNYDSFQTRKQKYELSLLILHAACSKSTLVTAKHKKGYIDLTSKATLQS